VGEGEREGEGEGEGDGVCALTKAAIIITINKNIF
jgi:hypothetical protein